MNHQARPFNTTKGTVQRPCTVMPACLAAWPDKGQTIKTTDHPIISNDFDFYASTIKTYDNNDRLRTVNYPDAKVVYTFDAKYDVQGCTSVAGAGRAGATNRQTETTTSVPGNVVIVNKTYTYNNRNQLNQITDNLDTTQNVIYQFDANGNQIVKNKNAITTNFIYDVRDKLISVREGTTVQGTYLYDYQGLRVQKNGSQGLVKYTYDDDSVLIQTDNTGTTLAKYEYGPDRLLSLNHTTEGRQYYHFDALGSTVNLTKPDASLQARYQYDAFGNFRSQTGTSWNNFGFTGHEKDTATNLIYFKARFYDADTGRFLNQDPYLGEAQTPPSLNRYLYAYSNPTVWVDLTGYNPLPLLPLLEEATAATAASAGIANAKKQNKQGCTTECADQAGEAVKKYVDEVKRGFWRYLLNRLPVPNSANSEFDGKQEQLISNDVIPTSTSSPIADQNTGIALENPGGAGVELEQNYEGRPSNPIAPEMPSGDADPLPDVRPSPRPNQEGLIDDSPYLKEQRRDSRGRFLPLEGGEMLPGSEAVDQVVKDFEARKGWKVRGREITVTDSTGQRRRYDIVVETPNGKILGVEVKSGSARKTRAQREFDNRLNSSGGAVPAVGQKAKDFGIREIDRSITIRKK